MTSVHTDSTASMRTGNGSSITTMPLATISTTTANPYVCPGESIGSSCNVSSDPCEMAQPCLNAATCYQNRGIPAGYQCSCQTGYTGDLCQNDERPCQEDTCW